jgi:hypothetical protein
METCAISIQSCWSHIKRNWTYNTLESTLWWKGRQWLSQEPSIWPTTEVNTPTENLEIRNVHVSLLQPPEDMGELPPSRIQPSRPFFTTGVNYAGPLSLRLGTTRSKTTAKGYTSIAIFVCFVTKAVHIEVVTSLTTEAFLAALRRFMARRGKTKTIYSAKGTNFMKSTTCFNPLHIWHGYRTSWPPKDVTGD